MVVFGKNRALLVFAIQERIERVFYIKAGHSCMTVVFGC